MRSVAPINEVGDVVTRGDLFWIETFTIDGVLAVGSGADFQLPIPFDVDLVEWWVKLGTAPTGSSAVFEINRNGSPQSTIGVAAGDLEASASGSLASFFGGQFAHIDVNQVGSTIPGADAVMTLIFRFTS